MRAIIIAGLLALVGAVALADSLSGNYGLIEARHNGSALSATTGAFSSEVTGEGFEATGDYDNTPGADACVLDNNGLYGGQKLTDIAPQDLYIRPQPAFAGGTQTASDVNIFGGQDESKVRIDAADPSVTCPTDTVTVTVLDSNGASTATVLTEGTNWTAVASVATTCSNLATAVAALAGVGASCTSPDVLITLDNNTGRVTLAESDGNCTGATTGTAGDIVAVDILTVRSAGGVAGTDEIDIQHDGTTTRLIARDSGGITLQAASVSVSSVAGGTSSVSIVGQVYASTTAVTRTDVIQFCGNGPNGATAVYMEPLAEAALYADATCDGNDNTDENTAEKIWLPYDFSAVSMECGCNDVAVDTGLTFSFRDDNATASTDMECTTGAGDASGFVTCEDIDITPPTVAAGSAIAMRIVAASGNFSTADCWCRVTVSQ